MRGKLSLLKLALKSPKTAIKLSEGMFELRGSLLASLVEVLEPELKRPWCSWPGWPDKELAHYVYTVLVWEKAARWREDGSLEPREEAEAPEDPPAGGRRLPAGGAEANRAAPRRRAGGAPQVLHRQGADAPLREVPRQRRLQLGPQARPLPPPARGAQAEGGRRHRRRASPPWFCWSCAGAPWSPWIPSR